MKNGFNKSLFQLGLVALLVAVSVPACQIETIENPNAPTISSVSNGASLADLQLLVSGIESQIRFDMEYYFWTVSMVGREYYDLRGTDPRYTGELTGASGAPLDNNGFLTTRAFAQAYQIIRNTNILLDATENSKAGLTDAGKNAIRGFAKTIQAYNLLLVLNRHQEARIDVKDILNPGPFVDYAAGLTAVAALLDEANTNLANAGTTLPFSLSSGYAQANTPAGLSKFNRSLAARVHLYRGDKAAALTALGASFYDVSGDLADGVYHVFGLGGNERLNTLFYAPDVAAYVVPDDFFNKAEAGDARVANKTRDFDGTKINLPILRDGYTGTKQVALYKSNTDRVAIIRNEELILIAAELNIGTNNTAVVDHLNVIRAAAGLPAYTGGTDDAALLTEVVKQRRYALFGEGHRWLDLRRLNRLNEIVIDRPGDVVHTKFPRPLTEG